MNVPMFTAERALLTSGRHYRTLGLPLSRSNSSGPLPRLDSQELVPALLATCCGVTCSGMCRCDSQGHGYCVEHMLDDVMARELAGHVCTSTDGTSSCTCGCGCQAGHSTCACHMCPGH
jgi:hypothetical protein